MSNSGRIRQRTRAGMARFRNLRARCHDWLLGWIFAFGAVRIQWAVRQIDGRFRVTKNSIPFDLNGVAGWDYVHLDEIPRIGGTAFRGRADLRGLNEAWRLGLHVLVNLPTIGEASGLDWNDTEQVAQQTKRIVRLVRRLRHHPAVMMWSVGNEIDIIHLKPGELRPHHPRLWEHLNDLARAVKRADSRRLVCVCTSTTGVGSLESRASHIAQVCPDIDLLGWNNFRNSVRAISIINSHWKRPFFYSEWGPTGAFGGKETAWGATLEPTSSEKAALVSQRYQNLILPATRCVGGFLYFWGERNERTHTWFGLFRDGMRTQSLDVMQKHWTNSWPATRAPSVFKVSIAGVEKEDDVTLLPAETCEARVHCPEAGSRAIETTWHLRAEVHRPQDDYAGKSEKHPGPIPLNIVFQDAKLLRFVAPSKPGAYRLFVQVARDFASVGYGNIPFHVGDFPMRQ